MINAKGIGGQEKGHLIMSPATPTRGGTLAHSNAPSDSEYSRLFPHIKEEDTIEVEETISIKEEEVEFVDDESDYSDATDATLGEETPAAPVGGFADEPFLVKEIVFAKIAGYPPWPARVEEVIIKQTNKAPTYRVFFFGTHDTGFARHLWVKPFHALKDRMKEKYKRKIYQKALEEAETNPDFVPAVHLSTEADEKKTFKPQKKAIKRRLRNQLYLRRTLFTSRTFFFGNIYDAGVLKKDSPPPKEPATSSKVDDSALVSKETFAEVLGRLSNAITGLKSSQPARTDLDFILGRNVPITE